MANICSFYFGVEVSEQDAESLKGELAGKLDDQPGRLFNPVIDRASLFESDDGRLWAAIDGMGYQEGRLVVVGQCKWDPPGWLGVWLAKRTQAAVTMAFSVEDEDGEEWRYEPGAGWQRVPEPEPEPEPWEKFDPLEMNDKWS